MGALEAAGDAKDTLFCVRQPFREEGHERLAGTPVLRAVDRADRRSRARRCAAPRRRQGLRARHPYPARFGGRAVHAATSALDLLPTVLRLAGAGTSAARPRAGRARQPRRLGRDLAPLLDGTGADVDVKYLAPSPTTSSFTCAAAVSAVRHGRFSALRDVGVDDGDDAQTQAQRDLQLPRPRPSRRLFDMYRDPAELAPLDATAPSTPPSSRRSAPPRRAMRRASRRCPRRPSGAVEATDLPCCAWRRVVGARVGGDEWVRVLIIFHANGVIKELLEVGVVRHLLQDAGTRVELYDINRLHHGHARIIRVRTADLQQMHVISVDALCVVLFVFPVLGLEGTLGNCDELVHGLWHQLDPPNPCIGLRRGRPWPKGVGNERVQLVAIRPTSACSSTFGFSTSARLIAESHVLAVEILVRILTS